MKTQPDHSSEQLKIADLLWPHWKAMTVALLAVAAEIAAELLEPWPLKIVLDNLLQGKKLPAWMGPLIEWLGPDKLAVLNFAVLGVAVIAVVGALGSYIEKHVTTSIGQWVMHDLRRKVYHHIHRLSLAEHEQKRTGDLIGRVTDDIDAVQSFVTTALLGILTNILTLVGILCVMLYLNWRFTLISLAIAPVLFGAVYFFTRRIKKASRDVRKKESELVSMVEEVFSSIRVVKAFAREDYEEKRFERQSLENVEAAMAARNIKTKLSPVVEVIVATGTCLMLGYGARLVLAEQLTAGALVVFLLYLGKMYKPMRDLAKMTDTVSGALIGLERIREILDTKTALRDLPQARPAPAFRGKIEFDHVSFGYQPDQLVLDDVSFAIEPGQTAAFVGPTGGGKSTVIHLVARFYDPLSGEVRIDGTNIRDFRIQSVREQISFVLQETLLFRAPVWENIAYGRPEASRSEIIEAATLANAHEFIEQMHEGYDTMIGEHGATLSGGQRQRIEIARAVIRQAPILILDEPTSGLDAASEQLVFEALTHLMKGKTCMVIAHHLQTIRKADVIFVVNDNALVARGSHDELLAAGGLYAELYRIQFQQSELPPGKSQPLSAER